MIIAPELVSSAAAAPPLLSAIALSDLILIRESLIRVFNLEIAFW